MDTFTHRIRQARKECKLTQGQAAKALGIDVMTLGGYENGINSPRHTLIIAMAKLYQCDIAFLFGEQQTKKV